ncbi:hypothetical protein ACFWDQ_27360 [Streptomyces sp. NPDC060053]|uniref:hypothetical protein n=1 Tax=Streptomyces sp. NPDC060053 TaxID=3347047 RepID=UPI0036A681B8
MIPATDGGERRGKRAREQIRSLVLSGDTFDQPADELRELRLGAAREAFTAHRERIPLLRTRAEETGVHEITSLDDLVPQLFSHTSYKSYPVSLITAGRWDRLLRRYTTVSAVEPDDVDVDGRARRPHRGRQPPEAAVERPVHRHRDAADDGLDVVPVADLSEAVGHAGVATQTVGVYPPSRKAGLRDALACAGVQRVVSLGAGRAACHRVSPTTASIRCSGSCAG